MCQKIKSEVRKLSYNLQTTYLLKIQLNESFMLDDLLLFLLFSHSLSINRNGILYEIEYKNSFYYKILS